MRSSISSGHLLALFMFLVVTSSSGCGTILERGRTGAESCNFRTYTNARLIDYVSSRYDSSRQVRVGILPFEVPETFADQWDNRTDFGVEFARRVQAELLRTGEVGIVEFFDRDRWPGKREDFFAGNYQAISFARDAGYDFVVVGYVEAPKNPNDLGVYTKIIDTSNGVTVWYGLSQVTQQFTLRRIATSLGLVEERRDRLYFPERVELLALCAVQEMLFGAPVP